jgi:hypothetical protein
MTGGPTTSNSGMASTFAPERCGGPVQVNRMKNVISILTSGTEIGLISVTSSNGAGFARIHIRDITSTTAEPSGSVLQCSVQHL